MSNPKTQREAVLSMLLNYECHEQEYKHIHRATAPGMGLSIRNPNLLNANQIALRIK